MRKSIWLVSAGLFAIATPAAAQQTDTDAGAAQPTDGATTEAGDVDAQTDTTQEPQATETQDSGDIVVTATRRNEALSDVPLAVSAVTAQTLENSGANDIRALTQVSPSLLVSSTSSEAGAGGARIRGIGTVGDNPGLESSVAVFIDGVYRSRIGVGLTELGQIDRVEVLRGPQGTLFGRNASAGLLSIITVKPRFETAVNAEATVGNYDLRRFELGVTGALTDSIAARLDGIYMKRDGFLKDVISGRRVNDRDRYLLRGQLLFQPNDNLSFRLIGDYSKRDEECCAASYLPARDYTSAGEQPSTIALYERSLGASINDDTFERDVSITPGRSYRSDVKDYGVSGELVYDFGGAELTSITAYRYNKFIRGQDADFNNLDILYRGDDGSAFNRFKTFTQELRLQGEAFSGRLDWLVGGYFADEKLDLADNLSTGADADRFFRGLIQASSPALAAFPGFNLLNAFAQGFVGGQLATNPAFAGIPVAARPIIVNAIASQVVNTPLSNQTTRDLFKQESRNFALFTHNIVEITDSLKLTLGARYTREKKTLEADLNSTSVCADYVANIVRLRTLAAQAAANPALFGALTPAVVGLSNALAGNVLTPIGAAPCAINSVNGDFDGGRKKESQLSGTAVLSFKPTDSLLTYVSYSKGYKAGGFNLDRAGLTFGAVDLNDLRFKPELVDAFEIGAKYNGPGIDVNVALFRQDFKNFQLNTFNGVNFVVENINRCSEDLNGADTDNLPNAANPAPQTCDGKRKPGVRSQGIEIETFFRPIRNVSAALGATLVNTKYRNDLTGTNGDALTPALFQLPGQRLSNSAKFSATGSLTWTPPIGSSGLSGLVYVDGRRSSKFNTGSDLDREKLQKAYSVFNARVGLRGPDQRWAIELWAQNVFNKDYLQVAFDAPLQGGGTREGVDRGFIARSNQLFGAFVAEPRTVGLTFRTRFQPARRVEEVAPPAPPPPAPPPATQTCADGSVILATDSCPLPPAPPPPPPPAPERG
jgi:outer membrane receptor protein involved in Fe transport